MFHLQGEAEMCREVLFSFLLTSWKKKGTLFLYWQTIVRTYEGSGWKQMDKHPPSLPLSETRKNLFEYIPVTKQWRVQNSLRYLAYSHDSLLAKWVIIYHEWSSMHSVGWTIVRGSDWDALFWRFISVCQSLGDKDIWSWWGEACGFYLRRSAWSCRS